MDGHDGGRSSRRRCRADQPPDACRLPDRKAKASPSWKTCRSGIIAPPTRKNTSAASRSSRRRHEKPVCRHVLRTGQRGSAALRRRRRHLAGRLHREVPHDFPPRFVNTGVAEQIMIGMVAGMAQRGLRPFAYTIATFSLYRPFEMVRDDLCYQNLPVTIVGIGGGVTYSTLGAPITPKKTWRSLAPSPIWPSSRPAIRERPKRPRAGAPPRSGARSICVSARRASPTSRSRHLTPWVSASCAGCARRRRLHPHLRPDHEARFRGRRAVCATGRSAAIVSVHTLKPLDVEGIWPASGSFKHVVVIEECAPNGGLAMRVKEIAWDRHAPAGSTLSRSRTSSSTATAATTTSSMRMGWASRKCLANSA